MVLDQTTGILIIQFLYAAQSSLCEERLDGIVVGTEDGSLGIGILQRVIEVGMFEQFYP